MRMLGSVLIGWGLSIATAAAAEHVWVIGGGPDPHGSQAQIETNVNWVINVLRQSSTRQLHVYYTDGNGPGKDVKLWTKPKYTKETLHPLARVFDQDGPNGETYYDHKIPNVSGTTESGPLQQRLKQEFSALKPGDKALLVYNGHGLQDVHDAAGNTLRLWKDTSLSARELEQLLGNIDPRVPVRFVFTQCYSGGFARLIRPAAKDVKQLNGSNRCGFLAESEARESEGCSASINVGDYRDYTTFFFAALQGKTRSGERLSINPDIDQDGKVSPYEAHLYALGEAHNADLPRSTSEVYLERWQPWYLRWFDTGAEPENLYGRMAGTVARRYQLPESGRALARALGERRTSMTGRMASLEAEEGRLRDEVKEIQKSVKKDLNLRWPELRYPYTQNYAKLLQRDITKVQDFILAHPRYNDLATHQERILSIREEMFLMERDITQIDKIRRLRQLARLLNQFERHASKQARAEYDRLMVCEQLPL